MSNQAPETDVLQAIMDTVKGWLKVNLPEEWAMAWLPEVE